MDKQAVEIIERNRLVEQRFEAETEVAIPDYLRACRRPSALASLSDLSLFQLGLTCLEHCLDEG